MFQLIIIIEKIIYPAGTEKEMIARDLLSKLRGIIEPFYYLSDETCSYNHSGFGVYETLKQKGELVMVLKTLDEVFKEEVGQIMIGGEDFPASESNFKITAEKLINLMTEIAPSKFVIVSDHIADHLNGDLLKKYGESFIEHRSCDIKGFVAFLATLLSQIYQTANITQIEKFSQIEETDLDNATAVIMVDRHHALPSSLKDITKWNYAAKLFILPFANTLAYLEKLGKVKVDFDGLSLFNRLGLPKI